MRKHATKLRGYLTIYELAATLGVSHSAAARYVREGMLKGVVDIGGQRLVPAASLEKFRKPLAGNPNWRRRKT